MSKDRYINDVVVLGGGTAGWITALYVKAVMPDKTVTLIESEEIGILGAGEGTVPHVIRLFDLLDIPVSRLMKHTNATLKNGIKFTNWNNEGDDDSYFHSFSSYNNISQEHLHLNQYVSQVPPAYAAGTVLKDKPEDIDYMAKISRQNKVPFLPNESMDSEVNPIRNFENVGAFAVHMDANLMAAFLREIAEERGIVRVEGIVESYETDSDGEVSSLVLNSGEEVLCEFVFDCSGFKRFFHKEFKSEWVSYKDKLPVTSAVPFFLPMEEDSIPSYTEAIAMKYGWMWKIPLQNRYGCGYVFDESLITEAEAKKEVEDYLGFEITSPRTFRFEAGYYKTPWVKNVISIGLSSGFIEPLEATSIWTSILTLKDVLASPEILHSKNEFYVEEFNKAFSVLNDEIFNFIYFHYMSGRDDTEFWKKFTRENAPQGLKDFYDKFDHRLPTFGDFDGTKWSIYSWYQVALGTNQLDMKNKLELYNFHSPAKTHYKTIYLDTKQIQDNVANLYSSDHKAFIDYMKE